MMTSHHTCETDDDFSSHLYRYRYSDRYRYLLTVASPAQTAEPIETPFGLRTWVGPENHVMATSRHTCETRDFQPESPRRGICGSRLGRTVDALCRVYGRRFLNLSSATSGN